MATTPDSRSRRELKKEESRQAIALAAVGLFEEKGFEAATMDEIAVLANVSRPTVFNYFARKEEILVFFMAWMMGEEVAVLVADLIALDVPPIEAVKAVVLLVARKFHAYPQTSRAFHMLRMQHHGQLETFKPPATSDLPLRQVFGSLVGFLERAQAAGAVRRDFRAAEILPHLLIGLFASTIGRCARGECGDETLPEVIDRHFDLYLNGISGH